MVRSSGDESGNGKEQTAKFRGERVDGKKFGREED